MIELCECGDPHHLHRRRLMSVPMMPNPTPLYPVATCFGIAKPNPDALYDHDECPCGCSQYEPLTDEPEPSTTPVD